MDLKLRRSPHLMMYFHRNRLLIENYLSRQIFEGSSDTLNLLSFFSEWRTLSQARTAFGEYTRNSISSSARNLLKNGLLVTKRSDHYEQSQEFAPEWLWPAASRYYHFSTKITQPSTRFQNRSFYEKNLKGKRQPKIFKWYPKSRRVKLLNWRGAEAPIFRTLTNRHTTRSFTGTPISLRELSRIVYYTWGKISTYQTLEFGPLLHKTSPSAGARHPIEVYPIINRVDGLQPGIYHYSVRDHSLELLRKGDYRKRCVSLTAGHTWVKDVSVLFIMTAVVARTAWKYRIARVYRAFLLDAGHLSQTFLLISTALGLGACCIGTINDRALERELGLDGITETVIFALGVGKASPSRKVLASESVN